MTLEFHPFANIFPLIEGPAFDELVADIKANGLREPIVLHEGKILDGRNRYRAALQAGVIDERGKAIDWNHHRPTFRQFATSGIEGDPLAWVISANLHRRHLDDGQRAMVASRLATLGHGGARVPKAESKGPIGPLEEEPPLPLPVMTQAAAAQALNVSVRQVKRARVVEQQGAPELVAAADAGRVAVSVAADLAKLPVEEQREVLRSASPTALYRVIKDQRDALTAQKKTKRAEKVKALGAKQRALPAKKFGVIYADPEWEHKPWSESGQNKAAANHYPVSPIDAIKTRPVGDIAARDCVLFMWTTAPHLAEAFDVIKAWGFTYKSNMVWKKIYPGNGQGLGYWSRINHEHLLIATRGDVPAPAPGTQYPSVIEAPVGAHSEKPEAFAQLIESYFGDLPKIELNARQARPGWDVWGLEAPEAEPEAAEPADQWRRPSGPSVRELCPPGTIVRTNYGTGPYEVVDVSGPHSFEHEGERLEHFSLNLCHVAQRPAKGKPKAHAWVNDLVAVDGRLLKICGNNDDEVLIGAPEAEGDFPDAPTDGETVEVPAFLRRTPASVEGAA